VVRVEVHDEDAVVWIGGLPIAVALARGISAFRAGVFGSDSMNSKVSTVCALPSSVT
jgi:hypothetical protein